MDTPINAQALPAGTRLEEFVIESILGSGGFGVTYLARDTSLGRQVVIKENLPAQFCFRDPSSLTVAPRHTTGEDAENFRWSLENFSKEAAMLLTRHIKVVTTAVTVLCSVHVQERCPQPITLPA
jgi:hypothetical protein